MATANILKTPLAILVSLLLVGAAPAQPGATGQQNPVTLASAKVAPQLSTREFQAEIELKIAPPFHIYGLKAVAYESPTAVKVAPGSEAQVELAGPVAPDRPPEHHADDIAPYDYWEEKVTLTVPLRLKDPEPGEKLAFRLVVEYMACTSEFCLPPKTLPVELKTAFSGDDGGKSPPETTEPEEVAKAPVRIGSVIAPESVELGRTFKADVVVKMSGEYHIYGFQALDVELPTSFRLDPATAGRAAIAGEITATPEPLRHEAPDYLFWSDEVVFSIPLKLREGTIGQETRVGLVMEYQACTDEACLPPAEAEIYFTVRVAAPTGDPAPTEGPAATEVVPAPPVAGPESSVPPPAARRARLEPSAMEPGEPGSILLPLPPAALTTGTSVVPRDSLRLGTSDLEVTGPGVVEVHEGVRQVRFPIEVSKSVMDEGPISTTATLEIAGMGALDYVAEGRIERGILGFILLAITSALIALMTPCVFPMIPITISFFTKQGERSQKSPVALGLTYCAGIVLSFVALGVLFTVLLGAGGASGFAMHWVTQLLIALLFIVFALSLFGLFEIQLPASVMNLVGQAQGKGGTLGVWLLGLLFAVTTFTCTAPFVGNLLAAAALTGEWTRPVLGMLVFSGVLAVPFFFFSAFPSRIKSLPKSGGWLNEVKVCMGFIELAAAFKFLGGADMVRGWGFFSRYLVLCVWIALFVMMAVYLLGLIRLPHDTPKPKVGVVSMLFALASLVFALYLARGLSGESLHPEIEPYLPMEAPARTPQGRIEALARSLGAGGAGGQVVEKAPHFKNDYALARAKAKETGRLLFLNFTGYT